VGLIARSIEEAGIPTVYIGSCRDMMSQVKAPRAVFVDFPLGRQCGGPGDVELQTRILRDALEVLASARVRGRIVDLPYAWEEPFGWESYQRDVADMLQDEGATVQHWAPSTRPA
jgi:hypothetical protein